MNEDGALVEDLLLHDSEVPPSDAASAMPAHAIAQRRRSDVTVPARLTQRAYQPRCTARSRDKNVAMNGALDILQTVVDFLFALTFMGAPFLLWQRSKTAAWLGFAAGASYFLTLLIGLIFSLGAARSPMSPMAVRFIYTLLSAVRNLAFYSLLLAMVLVLAKNTEASR